MRIARFPICIVLALMAQPSWAEREVVLVAHRDSPIESISSLDLRKVYLGIVVEVAGKGIRAVRRRDDNRINQIFLQSVIAMSKRSYERRLLSLVLKFGTPRPQEVDDYRELSALLEKNPVSIAYVWKSEAEADASVKIIRVLWQEY